MKKHIVAIVLVLMYLVASALAEETLSGVISAFNDLDDEDIESTCMYDSESDSVMLMMKVQYTAEYFYEALDGHSEPITAYRHMLDGVAKSLKGAIRATERPYISFGVGLLSSDDVLMAFADGIIATWEGDFEDWNEISLFY